MSVISSSLGKWKDLSKQSKIAVIRQSRREGISAEKLGRILSCGRGAILAFAFRNGLSSTEPIAVMRVAEATERAHTIKRKRGRKSRDFDHKMAFRRDRELQTEAKKRSLKAVFAPDHPANRNALLLSLVELEDHSCRWPIEVGSTTRYCGCTKVDASKPYCAQHCALSKGTWVAPKDETPNGGTS